MVDVPSSNRPEEFVLAAHFLRSDSAALFGAHSVIGDEVQLIIIDDPDSPLLRRHAEFEALAQEALPAAIDERFAGSKLAELTKELLGNEDSRQERIEDEIRNLRSIMAAKGMVVFALVGGRERVERFIEVYKDQPAANDPFYHGEVLGEG